MESLYDVALGRELPLPVQLASLYGRLAFPEHAGGPHIFANFVETLDGVVSLGIPGKAGGGEISGFNAHDRMVMGLLRAVSDAVIVGAGTLRAVSPNHLWTADYICPAFADAYGALRTRLGKREPPLNVIVSARGQIDLALPLFQSGKVQVLIVTVPEGAQHLAHQRLPTWVQARIATAPHGGLIGAREILDAVARTRPSDMILVEGGPRLIADFFAQGCLDEQFLTLAPQVAGRDSASNRPGLVMGQTFAPDHPVWGTLVEVKRGGNHLFLRYMFETSE